MNITHTSAPAPMMPTTFHNFSETATLHNKQFLATALKLQAMLSPNEASEPKSFENFYTTSTFIFQYVCSLI
jgi:hypothetical protein